MTRLAYLIFLILLVSSCGEKDIPRFINENSEEIIRYKIELSNKVITSFLKYSNDSLIESTSYFFSDSVIEQITTNREDQIIRNTTYFLGDNSYAKYSIDSIHRNYGVVVYISQYEYEGTFLFKTLVSWRRLGDNPDSSSYTLINTVEEGNITKIENIPPGEKWGCNDYYRFNDQVNIIDIHDFTNGITGQINSNLMEHISWYSNCHSLPSTTTPSSDLSYELDGNGYVVKKVETITPAYHTSSEEVKRTIYTSIYEYNVR
jgi:hypothetical protein